MVEIRNSFRLNDFELFCRRYICGCSVFLFWIWISICPIRFQWAPLNTVCSCCFGQPLLAVTATLSDYPSVASLVWVSLQQWGINCCPIIGLDQTPLGLDLQTICMCSSIDIHFQSPLHFSLSLAFHLSLCCLPLSVLVCLSVISLLQKSIGAGRI